MALASDDIWQKFDLFTVDNKDVGKSESLGSIENVPYFSEDNITKSNSVPDIGDPIFDFEAVELPLKYVILPNLSLQESSNDHHIPPLPRDRILNLPFIDLENLDSSETLRHDCMWSGLCPSEECRINHGASKQKRGLSTSKAEVIAGTFHLQSTSYQLSVFDTPIQSDLEGSDLYETISDIGIEGTDERDRSGMLEGSGGDHNHTSAPSLTPVQSEEEVKNCDASRCTNTAHIAKIPKLGPTIITSPPVSISGLSSKKACGGSAAKFKFQVKFMFGLSLSPESLSLLRHTNCPAKVQEELIQKGRGMVRHNNFHPTSVKRPQVQRSRGVRQRQKRKEKGREVRDLQNFMQRRRRVDMKNAFEALKICLPDIAETDRASKLMILGRAADFCQELTKKESAVKNEIEKEARRNQLLQKKLTMLRTLSKMS